MKTVQSWKLSKAGIYSRDETICGNTAGTYYASETAEETVKTWLLQPQMKITIHLIRQDRQEILCNGIAYNLKSRIANHWAYCPSPFQNGNKKLVKWKKYERFHIFIGPYFLHFMVSAPCQQFLNAPVCTHQWLTELLRKVNCALLQKCTHPFRFVPFKLKKIFFRGGCMWLQVNLCQKLFFLKNMGRTCCVQTLFWMSKTISVHNMFFPGLSLEFSCIELVIQWTICRHIVV